VFFYLLALLQSLVPDVAVVEAASRCFSGHLFALFLRGKRNEGIIRIMVERAR
jgi:hypothetical protein